jgi:glyoxylase-like metal-dependent hydrolase (beta-lactamase superfamily II)
MTRRPLTRRRLLLDAGHITLGALVLGVAGCAAEGAPDGAAGTSTTGPPGPASTPPPATTASDAASPAAPTSSSAAWSRVDLGFVSAYVLVRDGEAVLIDTGIGGSADAIGETLAAAGARWEDLAHVVVTHRHPDHAGSLGEVLDRAAGATAYVGRGDLDAVATTAPADPVDDGDTVAGLTIVGTPGHTPGHVSVLDPSLGVLLTGDAVNGADGGGVTGPNPRFTEDMQAALASVRTLAGLTYDTVLFGHGEPLTSGGAGAVEALADDLGA